MPRLPLLLLASLAAVGCGPEAPRLPQGPARLSAALVDSVPFENPLGAGWLRRVIIRSASRLDTIDALLTAQQPVVRGDSAVVGFRYEDDRVLGTFSYTPRTRTLRAEVLPADFFAYGTPRFSPDGRRVAYLGRDSTGAGYGVVLDWPSGRVRFRSAPVVLLATDAGVDDIMWDGPDAFTVAIALDAPAGYWQRLRGRLAADGVAAVVVDSMTTPRH